MIKQCVYVCVCVYLLAVVVKKGGSGLLASVRYLGTPVWALATAPAQRYPKCGRRCALQQAEGRENQRQRSGNLSAFEQTTKRVREKGTDEVKGRVAICLCVCVCKKQVGRLLEQCRGAATGVPGQRTKSANGHMRSARLGQGSPRPAATQHDAGSRRP